MSASSQVCGSTRAFLWNTRGVGTAPVNSIVSLPLRAELIEPMTHEKDATTTSYAFSPTPCLRCKSDAPLTLTPRNELYFYTARLSVSPPTNHTLGGINLKTDVDQQPRGRLCERCTRAFVGWLKEHDAPDTDDPYRAEMISPDD